MMPDPEGKHHKHHKHPLTPDDPDFEEQVKVAAYYMWQRRIEMGWPGDDLTDWEHGKAQIEQIGCNVDELNQAAETEDPDVLQSKEE